MSQPLENGGQAFPISIRGFHGMTLRDYFAACVLPQFARDASEASEKGDDTDFSDVAQSAYDMADEMLKAREKRKEGA